MPALRIPSVVLELALGILVGPALGLVGEDDPVTVLALVGLAMLLFLAGLELDVRALCSPLLRRAGAGFGATLLLAGLVGLGLEAIGVVGLRFDLQALTNDAATLLHVPIFLAALVVARALPAVLYAPVLTGGRRELVAAGLLQATSLPFLVTASAIGLDLGLLTAANAAALVTAGLVSVLVFPAAALALLTRPPDPRLA